VGRSQRQMPAHNFSHPQHKIPVVHFGEGHAAIPVGRVEPGERKLHVDVAGAGGTGHDGTISREQSQALVAVEARKKAAKTGKMRRLIGAHATQ
jgi:hypothetical protein